MRYVRGLPRVCRRVVIQIEKREESREQCAGSSIWKTLSPVEEKGMKVARRRNWKRNLVLWKGRSGHFDHCLTHGENQQSLGISQQAARCCVHPDKKIRGQKRVRRFRHSLSGTRWSCTKKGGTEENQIQREERLGLTFFYLIKKKNKRPSDAMRCSARRLFAASRKKKDMPVGCPHKAFARPNI